MLRGVRHLLRYACLANNQTSARHPGRCAAILALQPRQLQIAGLHQRLVRWRADCLARLVQGGVQIRCADLQRHAAGDRAEIGIVERLVRNREARSIDTRAIAGDVVRQ